MCFSSPGSATPIFPSPDANFAALGAADVTNIGFVPVAREANALGYSSATGSNGLSGTLAHGAPAGIGGAANRGNLVGLGADNQLATVIASLGSMEPDTLEPGNVGAQTLVPGLSSPAFGTSSFGPNNGTSTLGASNLTGALIPQSLGDPDAAWVVELPGSLFTSPGSPVNIIDVASDGGPALDWNIVSSATPDGIAFGVADLAAGGGLTGGISAIEAAADVPEPASLLLLGGGLLAAAAKRRKTRRGLRID